MTSTERWCWCDPDIPACVTVLLAAGNSFRKKGAVEAKNTHMYNVCSKNDPDKSAFTWLTDKSRIHNTQKKHITHAAARASTSFSPGMCIHVELDSLSSF